MSIYIVLLIVWTHFIADFIAQSNKQAINKSHSNGHLLVHSITYGLFFFWAGPPILLLAVIAHFCVDYVTSRISGYYFKQDRRHAFFVTIGADQAIHMTILLATFQYFKPF